MSYPATPELDRMAAVKEKSQAIGEFIDIFLNEKGFGIGQPQRHTSACGGWDDEGERIQGTANECGYHTGEFVQIHTSLEKLLAEFFEIDLNKAESERRAILEFVRKQNQDGGAN